MNDYTFTFHGVPPGSPVVIHLPGEESQVLKRLDAIADLINQLGAQIMATLADVQAATAAEDTVIDSAIQLLNGLAAQVAALTPDQAAIDALAADISAKTATLAAAVTANTTTPPVAPTVPVVTP